VRAEAPSSSSPFGDSARDPLAGSGNLILIMVAIFPVLLALTCPL
jgi:hypothetical protein